MKFQSAAVLSLALGSVHAFSPSNIHSSRCCSNGLSAVTIVSETKLPVTTSFADTGITLERSIGLAMPEEEPQVSSSTEVSALSRIKPGRYHEKEYSIALPMLKRPPALDGSHAGDYGFDPLGFTEEFDLYTMQEAEIRHARLAMLAVVGWPLAELVAPDWLLQENGRVPSVLNGFNLLTFPAMLLVFGAFGYFEYKTAFRGTTETEMGKMHHDDMADVWKWGVAGDYDFDPLKLYNSVGNDAYSRKGLREVEISHGRSAMLGITAFAGWEALTGHAIVENSMFFHPNLLLPALVLGAAAFSSVYELEDSDTFVRFRVSSEGAARLENWKRSMPDFLKNGPDAEKMEELISKISDMAEKVQKYFKQNVLVS